MASPYWSSPGASQGRIRPVEASPDHGFWDFCLGYDGEEPPEFMLNIGEVIKLEQTYDFSPMDFVNFCWVMRTPTELPQARTLVSAGTVEFVDGSLYEADDGCMGLKFLTDVMEVDDGDQLVTVSGSAYPANNGTFRLAAVTGPCSEDPEDPGVTPMLDRCVVENASMVEGIEYAVTAKLLGTLWRAQAYVDDVLRVELVEPAGHQPMRRSLRLHVSQVTGPVTMSFRLSLESVTP